MVDGGRRFGWSGAWMSLSFTSATGTLCHFRTRRICTIDREVVFRRFFGFGFGFVRSGGLIRRHWQIDSRVGSGFEIQSMVFLKVDMGGTLDKKCQTVKFCLLIAKELVLGTLNGTFMMAFTEARVTRLDVAISPSEIPGGLGWKFRFYINIIIKEEKVTERGGRILC